MPRASGEHSISWRDLAKTRFLHGTPPQVRPNPGRGQGRGPAWGGGGAGASDLAGDAARAEEGGKPREPAVLAGFRALHPRAPSPRVSPLAFAPPLTSGPRLSVCLLVSREPALSFPPASQARSSDPNVQDRGGPCPRGAQKAPSPFSPPRSCRSPRANPAPAGSQSQRGPRRTN